MRHGASQCVSMTPTSAPSQKQQSQVEHLIEHSALQDAQATPEMTEQAPRQNAPISISRALGHGLLSFMPGGRPAAKPLHFTTAVGYDKGSSLAPHLCMTGDMNTSIEAVAKAAFAHLQDPRKLRLPDSQSCAAVEAYDRACFGAEGPAIRAFFEAAGHNNVCACCTFSGRAYLCDHGFPCTPCRQLNSACEYQICYDEHASGIPCEKPGCQKLHNILLEDLAEGHKRLHKIRNGQEVFMDRFAAYIWKHHIFRFPTDLLHYERLPRASQFSLPPPGASVAEEDSDKFPICERKTLEPFAWSRSLGMIPPLVEYLRMSEHTSQSPCHCRLEASDQYQPAGFIHMQPVNVSAVTSELAKAFADAVAEAPAEAARALQALLEAAQQEAAEKFAGSVLAIRKSDVVTAVGQSFRSPSTESSKPTGDGARKAS